MACATGVGALACVGLLSWVSGQWRPVALGADYVPMAPSTAILLFLIGVATFVRARLSSSRRTAFILETFCGVTVIGAAGVLGLQQFAGFDLPIELWLARTSESVGGIPVGRMSPMTAVCFVLLGLALLCAPGTGGRRPMVCSLGGWLALLVFLVCGMVVVGYWAGSPFLYGGSAIPMAHLTGITFVLGSAATMLGSGSSTWPLCMFLVEDKSGRGLIVGWSLLLLFFLMVTGIILFGVNYVSEEQSQARERAHQELQAIAELKIQQIVHWQKERMADADFIRATPYAARRALDALSPPESATTRGMFTSWLKPLLAGKAYERALLLDAQLNVRLVYPEVGDTRLADPMRRAAEQALRTREVVVADLHRSPEEDHIHLDLIVPLVVRHEGNQDNVPAAGAARSLTDRSAGVLVMQINAHDFLFPLIQTWPTPSRTAETLLVRREGNEVLFLSELRHQAGTALALRRPLHELRLPGAMGLRGEHGVQAGVDYRGVSVVAAVQPVPNTPWMMVAKVDEAELYAPMRRDVLVVSSVMLMLLLTSTLGITVLWRRSNEQLLQTQLAAEQERRALAERFEHLMKNASDAILLADEHDRILEANDRACVLYGFTLEELQNTPLARLRAPEHPDDFERESTEILVSSLDHFETRHVRRDGSTFPVELSSRIVEIGGTRYKLDIIRDITQRKAHEAEIERLNRLYATLSRINQTITRLKSREELFQVICRIMAEHGDFKVVWVGWLDRVTRAVRPVARAGEDEGYLDKISVFADERPEGGGPVGLCIREGRASVFNDFANDPRARPWRELAMAHGVCSVVAVPIQSQGEVSGALAVYAKQVNAFQEREVALLEEAALDISFALDHLESETRRNRAEAALRRSEADLQLALEAGRLGDWGWNILTGEVSWSARCKALYGLPPETVMTYERFLERVHPEDRTRIDAALKATVANRAEYEVEKRAVWPDGSIHWNATRGRVFCDDAGQPVRMAGVSFDITERKLAEEALRRSQSALLEAQRLARIGNWESDNEGRSVTWSDELYRIYGRDRNLGPASLQEVSRYFTPESWARLSAAKEQTWTRGTPYECDAEVVRADGTRRWVTSRGEALRDASGRIIGLRGTTQDITERRRAEQALRRSEAHLRTLVKTLPDLVWLKDPQGVYLACNPRFESFFGTTEVEILGKTDYDFMDRQAADCFRAHDAAAMAAGGSRMNEEEVTFACDGHKELLETIKTPMLDTDGSLIGVLGIARDITARRRGEEALRRSEAFTRTVLDNLPVGIAVNSLSPAVSFTFMNDNFPRFYRTTREQLTGPDEFWGAVYEDRVFRDAIRKRILEDCASGDPARMFWQDIPILRAGQPPVFITARNIPLPEEGLVISTVWDVTPHKQAELALRTSEEQFRAMFELASIGMAQANPKTGQWLRVNQRMSAITGYSSEELLRLRVTEVTHPEDREQDRAAFQRVVRGEVAEYHLEKRYVRKDGSVAWVSENMTVIRDAAGEPMRTLATIEDITARKRLEEEREITVQLLGLLNGRTSLRNLMQAVTVLLRKRFNCEAVGIRLREGDDFPYFEARGFPARFVELENQLCTRDESGQPVRDSEGNPVLECMCGNVLCGRFDPAKPFFTARGSFWSNHTSCLLATTTPADRQARTRNRCNSEGYESVALVALRADNQTFGLIQLNDRREDRFTPERIALVERLADSLAMGLAHRQDQEQRQENEERLRLALAGANQGLYDLNVQTGAAVVSPEYARMLGYEPDELQETNAAWRERLHPDDREQAFQVYQDYIAGRREDYRVEFRQRTKAGDWKWILSLGRLVARDAEGKPLRMLGTHTDITERKLAEESIRRERILLRTVIDHLPDPIYVKDRLGAKTLANQAEIAWLGLQTEEEVLGKTDFELYPREIALGTQANDQQTLEKGVPILNREETVLDAQGRTHCVLTSRLPLRDASGGIVGLVGISHDITERKQAEEQVRQLSRAVEQSPAAVVITNPAGNIQYVNPKFTALTGYTLDEARGKNPRILKAGETPVEVYRELWRTIRAGGEWRGEFHNRKKNGELFWEFASISPIVDDVGRITHFLAVKEDITERKRLEQERSIMEAQLRHQQKLESIGTLASGVAHEINNPITGIMNYAQLIQDRLPTESPLTEFTGEIMHETQRVATIVRNLLTFARNEKQSHSPARMVDIVEAVLSLVRTVIRHDQITLNVNVPSDLPPLKCRSQQLQQVIMNVMTNARDALNERYPGHHPDKIMRVEASLFVKGGRQWIRLTVEDHGTGIAPEVRERMFDPFFTTKGRDQGTGLGLSISHGIVKEHYGELTVESELGHFTRMYVDLPVDNGWNV